jgi:putative ABC transport system permease protein
VFALRYALRNLLRNRRRSLVTLLGVATLLFLVSFLVAILGGLDRSPTTDVGARRLVARHQISLTFALPEAHWEKLRRLSHVEEVGPSNWFQGTYVDKRNFFPRFFVDPDTFLRIFRELTIPPEQVEAWKADRQGALVGRQLAEQYGFALGDQITIVGDIYPVTVELNVRAIYDGGEPNLYFHRAYVDEALGGVGVGTYWMLLDSPESLGAVAKAVDEMFADSDAPTKTETEQAFRAGFVEMMGNVTGLVTNLTAIIALTVLLLAGNTMAMAVRERTGEIAVLKALGFLPRRIVGFVLAESVTLALLAGLVGVGGFGLLTWLLFVVAEVAIPGVWFTPTLTPAMGAGLMALALLLGVVAGVVPALLAARRPVVLGLRRD